LVRRGEEGNDADDVKWKREGVAPKACKEAYNTFHNKSTASGVHKKNTHTHTFLRRASSNSQFSTLPHLT